MSLESDSKPTQICPTCGTRLSGDASRCLVCGTELSTSSKAAHPSKSVGGSRMPAVTLSLPAILGILALFLLIGAVLVYFALRQGNAAASDITDTPTVTFTPTVSLTPTPFTPTPTNTPLPTLTPLAYTVKLGDTCGSIAFAFSISIQSIVLENDLPADCSTLIEGQVLQIPHPTPTATQLPTATLGGADATKAACPLDFYEVKENDTLSGIAIAYDISMTAIREWNGMVNDVVRFGQTLEIPLCLLNATPGPTSTPTLPPPYPSVNLLLPPDGAPFTLGDEVVTLQWASVGSLRENEAYAVHVEDITEGEGRKIIEYVTDTKYIVPATFRAGDNTPHVYRWWVLTVRQVGTDDDGNPIWDAAGAISNMRVFVWLSTSPAATPTP